MFKGSALFFARADPVKKARPIFFRWAIFSSHYRYIYRIELDLGFASEISSTSLSRNRTYFGNKSSLVLYCLILTRTHTFRSIAGKGHGRGAAAAHRRISVPGTTPRPVAPAALRSSRGARSRPMSAAPSPSVAAGSPKSMEELPQGR